MNKLIKALLTGTTVAMFAGSAVAAVTVKEDIHPMTQQQKAETHHKAKAEKHHKAKAETHHKSTETHKMEMKKSEPAMMKSEPAMKKTP